MLTMMINKQKMQYSIPGAYVDEYKVQNGQIVYVEVEGEKVPVVVGKVMKYSDPAAFSANINNKLAEVLVQQFGIDDSTNYAQIVASKGLLPLLPGALIWKKSDIQYTVQGLIDENSADYVVKGVADEGLNFDLFLLQKVVK